MWRRSWEPITGRVIASDTTGLVQGGSWLGVRHKYVIEYRVDGGETRRVKLKQAWSLSGLPKMVDVSDRDEVPLLLNRRSGRIRFDAKNPAINFKARLKAKDSEQRAVFDDALKGESHPTDRSTQSSPQ